MYGLLPIIVLAIGDGFFKYLFLAIGAILVITIVIGVLTWLRFTYEVTDDELHIKQGILVRKDRYISKNRIQSIDLTQGIFHRPFGLTRVDIETAGSDKDVDASLSAVHLSEGRRVKNELKGLVETGETKTEAEKQYPKRTITNRSLFIAGATSGSIGIIIGLFGLLFSQLENMIPDYVYEVGAEWLLAQAIITLVVLAIFIVVFLWLLGILGTFIKYGSFQITRFDDELLITRGLLEKKQMTIPLKRIQAVGIEEGLTRQPFGLATVYVVIAGGEIGKTADQHTLLFPILKKRDISAFLGEILPEYNHIPDEFHRPPKRAIPYYIVRSITLPVLAVIGSYLFIPLLWVYIAIFAGAMFILGYFCYRDAGYTIKGRQLMVQMRRFSKETLIIPHNRVQSVDFKKHFLHRKQGLAQAKVSILSKLAGRHLWVKELEQHHVKRISDWI